MNAEIFRSEYETLIADFGMRAVNTMFSCGIASYIDSRRRAGYSLESIKQNLKSISNGHTIDGESKETYFNRWFNGFASGIGSFDLALFKAYIAASHPNKEKMKKAFPNHFLISESCGK